ncbi:MAG: hypothetical protein ABJH06_01740 [Paraglaciecola sp.]|uniref:hypothetical protein n=1 Tax=Paraglaciecola sp. TaxID=1920173 RepID=UPI003298A217
MIVSSDKEYIETKRYKRGEIQLQKPFSDIARWIEDNYTVKVLNVIYDEVVPNKRPRLQVCVEYREDCDSFRDSDGLNFHKQKQDEIIDQFIRIIKNEPYSIDTETLFVVFSAFAPIAREEANAKIRDKDIEQLVIELDNEELWKIRPSFGGVTFFFYTEEQAKMARSSDLLNKYSNEFFKLIKKYDEFDYLNKEQFVASFDSKEYFDKNYNGSWFAYDR